LVIKKRSNSVQVSARKKFSQINIPKIREIISKNEKVRFPSHILYKSKFRFHCVPRAIPGDSPIMKKGGNNILFEKYSPRKNLSISAKNVFFSKTSIKKGNFFNGKFI